MDSHGIQCQGYIQKRIHCKVNLPLPVLPSRALLPGGEVDSTCKDIFTQMIAYYKHRFFSFWIFFFFLVQLILELFSYPYISSLFFFLKQVHNIPLDECTSEHLICFHGLLL